MGSWEVFLKGVGEMLNRVIEIPFLKVQTTYRPKNWSVNVTADLTIDLVKLGR